MATGYRQLVAVMPRVLMGRVHCRQLVCSVGPDQQNALLVARTAVTCVLESFDGLGQAPDSRCQSFQALATEHAVASERQFSANFLLG